MLDFKEYEFHRKKYNYSDDLDRVIKGANEAAKGLMGKDEFPFSDEIMKEYYSKFLELKEHQEKEMISQ